MRGFVIVGAAVAISSVAPIHVLGREMAETGGDVTCRNQQILLAVNKKQNTIGEIWQDGKDLVMTADRRQWMALNRQRRLDIGLAA